MLTDYELDIPSLTLQGIELNYNAFNMVREPTCVSMNDGLLMIEMLCLLVNSFDGDVSSRVRQDTMNVIDMVS